MSTLTTISGVSSQINIGGSALSLLGMGKALIKGKNPKPGIDGFLFDMVLSDNVSHQAQITDHYTEDNSPIQDHIAFDPVKVTITGKVAELVYTKQAGLAFLQAAIDRLTPLNVLSPGQATQATRYISQAVTAISALDTVRKTYNDLSALFDDQPAKNAQQKAFQKFESMFFGRSLMTVETPWKTYENMAIESWSADQGDSSIFETEFTINFKEIRFVGTEINAGLLTGRIEQQAAPVSKKGNEPGKSTAASIFDSATQGAAGKK
jgi:hypothetical protein